jgi:hypothetical protein
MAVRIVGGGWCGLAARRLAADCLSAADGLAADAGLADVARKAGSKWFGAAELVAWTSFAGITNASCTPNVLRDSTTPMPRLAT